MKISFSTLGCPNWMWTEILAAAKDLGYDGIEIRGIGADIYAPDIKVFKEENTEKTLHDLNSLGLDISCFSSEFLLYDEKNFCVPVIRKYIDLASRLHCKNIRVLGDLAPQPSDFVNESLVEARLKELAPYAEEKGVNLLLETNGIYSDSKKALELIENICSSNVELLWDVHHTYRYGKESFKETFDRIGKYVKHIHLKDSIMVDGKPMYKLLGKGDLPILELIDLLKKNNYNDYVSLEWVKRWNDELEDAGIVFSHFINTIQQMIKN